MKKWYAITTRVDQETGEILTESDWKRKNYYQTKLETKIEQNERTFIKHYTRIGKPKGQYKLEL